MSAPEKRISGKALANYVGRKTSISIRTEDPLADGLRHQIIDLFEDWHRESVYRNLPYSAAQLTKTLEGLSARKKTALLLAAYDSAAETDLRDGELIHGKPRLVGVLAGALGPMLFSDALTGTVEHLYVHPDYRNTSAAARLLLAARLWSKKNGCALLSLPTNSGVRLEQADRMFRKLGFSPVGTNYAAPLT